MTTGNAISKIVMSCIAKTPAALLFLCMPATCQQPSSEKHAIQSPLAKTILIDMLDALGGMPKWSAFHNATVSLKETSTGRDGRDVTKDMQWSDTWQISTNGPTQSLATQKALTDDAPPVSTTIRRHPDTLARLIVYAPGASIISALEGGYTLEQRPSPGFRSTLRCVEISKQHVASSQATLDLIICGDSETHLPRVAFLNESFGHSRVKAVFDRIEFEGISTAQSILTPKIIDITTGTGHHSRLHLMNLSLSTDSTAPLAGSPTR